MRTAALLLAFALLGAVLWHARPVLVWHLTVRPEVERLGRTDRIHLDTERLRAIPDPGWPRLQAGRIQLLAPLRAGQEEACRRCREGCSLELGQGELGRGVLGQGELGQGRLALIDSALPQRYAQALATFAPSADDVSIWRPAATNWASVEGLAARAVLNPPPPPAYRYRGARSQGIVTRFESQGNERFVAYVYGLDGRPAGIVAASRTGAELLSRILGGVTIGDRVERAGCTEEAPWATSGPATR